MILKTQKKMWQPLLLGVGFFLLLAYCVNKRAVQLAKEKEILRELGKSPIEIIPIAEAVKPKEEQPEKEQQKHRSELVFFVEEHEWFKLEDLLESAADLRSQTLCSSLYKVIILKNNGAYAVKRLKKLQVSFEEFSGTMRRIGNMKHPNILPLVGYNNSSNEEKLLIYKYQKNGSLLNLLEDYIEGRRDFPWKHRLSIASGIARGLDFIYQQSINRESIPHGNIKLSNIMLNEKDEPLISEYGISKFLDPKRACYQLNGYIAPEKSFSEQGDVFSYGVILLVLLTGKTVEKSGLDLPKWVKSMVREEWTGEVFDKEVHKGGNQWAFPLLNISLKCVSNSPEDRPTMSEVLEKIEEVVNGQDDGNHSVSPVSSVEDYSVLHSIISETWDTPGSNH